MKTLSMGKKVTNGNVVFNFFVDGAETEQGYRTSRTLTGTTNEDEKGIFDNDGLMLQVGSYKKTFKCERLYSDDSASQRLQKIISRIEAARDWVIECKKRDELESGIASATLEPTKAELMAEIAILKQSKNRNAKGQFVKK